MCRVGRSVRADVVAILAVTGVTGPVPMTTVHEHVQQHEHNDDDYPAGAKARHWFHSFRGLPRGAISLCPRSKDIVGR